MKRNCICLIILLFFCQSSIVFAQKNFIEGQITYFVKIESADPKQNDKAIHGTLNLFLKGHLIVKELTLESGFKNTMLYNGNTKAIYALRKMGDEKYALQLDENQIKKKQEKCKKLTIEEVDSEPKTIADFKAQKAKLTCNNTEHISLYYTREWLVGNEHLFEDFPSFPYLPLAYSIKSDDGNKLHFELRKIEPKPIDNAVFKIPEGYKVISAEEYKTWKR